MNINPNVIYQKSGTSPSPVVSGKVKATAEKVSVVADQVRLSSSTPLLPSANGDFDAARVAEIRASISAGRYQVNTAKIADGLLSTVRDLLNKPSL